MASLFRRDRNLHAIHIERRDRPVEALEREHIQKALEHTGGNRALAAQLLGIDRVSLWRKLRRYNEEN